MNRLVEKQAPNNATRIKISDPASVQAGPNNNNIILLRGAQSDGGHIILQNGQELLQLLNGEMKGGVNGVGATATTTTTTSGKTIILQSPRIKQSTEANRNVKNRIMVHQTTLDHHHHQSQKEANGNVHQQQQTVEAGETILLQTNGLSGKRISATTLTDGSILLHPRMMDSFTATTTMTATTGTVTSQASGQNSSDGPILLQTLKRLDKSIFVLRNSSTTTSCAGTPATAKTVIGCLPSKMETSSGLVTVVAEDAEVPNVVGTRKGSASRNGSTSSGSGGGAVSAKANVFNKANNVIAQASVRSNGISTRSSTGQQKQRGNNNNNKAGPPASDSNKKDDKMQSNVPLGSGKWNFIYP